jgi:twitching motility protein PilT
MAKGTGPRKHTRIKLGDLLVEHGIITSDQLKAALDRQSTTGGRLGQNLIILGHIDEDTFIRFLSDQLKISCVNLKITSIPPETQRLIPLETIMQFGVLPLRKEKNALHVGMTDPTDMDALKELEFSLGKKIVPSALAESQWAYASRFFTDRGGYGRETLSKKQDASQSEAADYDLPALMTELLSRGGSDIHLSVGAPPTLRVNDQLVRLDYPTLSAAKIINLIQGSLTAAQKEEVGTRSEVDLAVNVRHIGRFRVNIYRQRGNMAVALRHVVEKIPPLDELNLPSWLADFSRKEQGLILVTGPSGHGKSTTLACLIDIINTTRRVNVVTLEDPIEYVHHHKKSNVNQRELGVDTSSFADGIKHIFRQDPDVISIGEMRDLESISTALTAAETGHLVLATLHTLNAPSTIDRIIDVFPGDQQNQVRHQLADSLLVILSQRLVPLADGSGRILALEKLANSYRIQNAIRDKRVHLIKTQSSGAQEDFSPMEHSLAGLCRKGLIAPEEGRKYAEDPKTFDLLMKK